MISETCAEDMFYNAVKDSSDKLTAILSNSNLSFKFYVNDLIDNWTVDFNDRKSSLGLCVYKERKIYLSRFLLKNFPREKVLDTILHEIAHALTPGDKHGKVWRTIYTFIGGSGDTTSEHCDKSREAIKSEYKYFVVDTTTNMIVSSYLKKPSRDFSVCYLKNRPETKGKLIVMDKVTCKNMGIL